MGIVGTSGRGLDAESREACRSVRPAVAVGLLQNDGKLRTRLCVILMT